VTGTVKRTYKSRNLLTVSNYLFGTSVGLPVAILHFHKLAHSAVVHFALTSSNSSRPLMPFANNVLHTLNELCQSRTGVACLQWGNNGWKMGQVGRKQDTLAPRSAVSSTSWAIRTDAALLGRYSLPHSSYTLDITAHCRPRASGRYDCFWKKLKVRCYGFKDFFLHVLGASTNAVFTKGANL
jgi:hypothetical protein